MLWGRKWLQFKIIKYNEHISTRRSAILFFKYFNVLYKGKSSTCVYRI